MIDAARKDGSSLGAIVECTATGVPAGWGAPLYAKLDSELAAACMSINAVKGVEIGDGFAAARLRGEQNADPMRPGNEGKPIFLANHAGGIAGGISTGQPIRVRVAFKPTSSILIPQETIDREGHAAEIATRGRHDPCVGIRRRAGGRGDDGAGACRPDADASRAMRLNRACALALLGFLAACGRAGDDNAANASNETLVVPGAETNVAEAPNESETAMPADPPLDELGGVKVGMTVAELRATGLKAQKDNGPDPDNRCGYARLPGVTDLFFMLDGDTVVRIDTDAPGHPTLGGVEVGMSEAEALRRLGDRAKVQPHPYTGPQGHYLVVHAPNAPLGLILETDGKKVVSYRIGRWTSCSGRKAACERHAPAGERAPHSRDAGPGACRHHAGGRALGERAGHGRRPAHFVLPPHIGLAAHPGKCRAGRQDRPARLARPHGAGRCELRP